MMKGTVKWFSDRKGYGFITDESGTEIFVHYSAVSGEGYKSLKPGDQVEFEVEEGAKGKKALNVIKL